MSHSKYEQTLKEADYKFLCQELNILSHSDGQAVPPYAGYSEECREKIRLIFQEIDRRDGEIKSKPYK
jgi:hypothetical protein